MKYVKSYYNDANGKISIFKNGLDSANDLTNKLDNYVYDILTKSKLEGEATYLIASKLNSYKEDLEKLTKKSYEFCDSAISKNSEISGLFGEEYTEVSDEKLSRINDKIEKIKELTQSSNSILNSISFENTELRSYWKYNISQYNTTLSALEEDYNKLNECLQSIKTADGNFNI